MLFHIRNNVAKYKSDNSDDDIVCNSNNYTYIEITDVIILYN